MEEQVRFRKLLNDVTNNKIVRSEVGLSVTNVVRGKKS